MITLCTDTPSDKTPTPNVPKPTPPLDDADPATCLPDSENPPTCREPHWEAA